MILLNSYRYAAGGSYDTDAQAFFTAASIADTTQKSAVNQLVLDLKSASIWTKMTALYPFVGGDATKHSYNLKAPASYQITWTGTTTHDANGITPNGTNAHGNTNLNVSVLSLNDHHISFYSRTAGSSGQTMVEMGGAAGSSGVYMAARYNNTFQGTSGNTVELSSANADAQGHYLLTRRSATDFEKYKNGASVQTDATSNAGQVMPGVPIYLGAFFVSGFGALSRSNRNLAFASIGASLTDAEVTAFSTAIEAFQDTLGRGVV